MCTIWLNQKVNSHFNFKKSLYTLSLVEFPDSVLLVAEINPTRHSFHVCKMTLFLNIVHTLYIILGHLLLPIKHFHEIVLPKKGRQRI